MISFFRFVFSSKLDLILSLGGLHVPCRIPAWFRMEKDSSEDCFEENQIRNRI